MSSSNAVTAQKQRFSVAITTDAYKKLINNTLQDPFFEQVFKPLLREECKKRKRELYIKGDERKKTDKATRIEANLEPIDRNGAWVFNEDEKDNPHMQELINQFKLFEMHLPYNADGPDCIEGGITLIASKTAEMQPTVTISYEELKEDNPYRM